jgi:Xaa-Pro aminopeptidase
MQAARSGLTVEIEDSIVASARAVKDESEMEALRRAGRVTDGTVEWVASLDLTGLTERQLARRISQHYTEAGHRPWDDLLIASGANAAMGHYNGDLAIDRSVPLLIDIGSGVDGYQSDTTRVLFPAKVETEVEDAYGAVLDAYQAALSTVAPGVPAQEVDRAARRVITQAGYGDRFNHRTGHGVGLDIHEHPYIREGNAEPLQVGNCFSIEPGIYVPGRFGLRYENLVLLTSAGPEVLNRTSERMSLG